MRVISLPERAAKATASLIVGLSFASCSSGSKGVDGENGGTTGVDVGVGGSGGPGYHPGSGGTSGLRDAGATGGSLLSGDANCGVQTSNTTQLPTDVLLVLDRSGSMSESIASDCCCASTCRNVTGASSCSNTSSCTERWQTRRVRRGSRDLLRRSPPKA